MYGIAALAIVAPIAFYGRYGALLLCIAVPLQWADSWPLRQALADRIRAPEKPHIDLAAWETEIRRHDSVRVLPQYSCLDPVTNWNHEIAVQLQLLAAVADRPINTVYSARPNADCGAEQKVSGIPQPGMKQLSVLLNEFSGFASMQKYAAANDMCRAGGGLIVCSDIPQEATALEALAVTDKK